jgi:hypothetical protein
MGERFSQRHDVNDHPSNLENAQLLKLCEVRRLKRGGPGGQHRNKTASAVVIKYLPSGAIAEANERRDQTVNLRRAIFRLRVQLALEIRTRRTVVPSPLWQSRCRNKRLAIDPEHDDFPRFLAEALDVIQQSSGEIRQAADALGCSQSQLVRLLSNDARALAILNAQRAQRDLPPLKSRAR